MKAKAIKQQDLEALQEEFRAEPDLFVMQFQGLSAVAVDALRKNVRAAKGRYHVVKNTLARKASEGTCIAEVAELFQGSTALVAVEDDPTQVAKALADFAKDHPAVAFKGGVVGGAALAADECQALAKVPSKDELIAKLLYCLQSPLQKLAGVLSAPPRDLAVVLQEVAGKKESD